VSRGLEGGDVIPYSIDGEVLFYFISWYMWKYFL